MATTLSQAVHTNQNAGETMDETVHRLAKPGETMTQCEARLADEIDNPPNPTNPPPDSGDDELDLDGDGKPDDVLFESGDVLITEDEDSTNVDINGDGVADIIIPKQKKKK